MQGFTRAVFWLIGIFGSISVLLYLLVFDVWVVPHGPDGQFKASVLPTLMPEDKILVQRQRIPIFGELARCVSPLASGGYVVGRVVGTPGDRVEIADDRVLTNGHAMPARHACPNRVVAHPLTENLVTMSCSVLGEGLSSFESLTGPTKSGISHRALVEAGKVYLVSDNRLMHQDSRDFGQVDAATCEHIVYRLWGETWADDRRRFTLLW